MSKLLELSSLLKYAVPKCVLSSVGCVATDLDDSALEEADVLGSVTSFRRNAYTTSRQLAKELLSEFGHREQTIGQGIDGGPIWPSGQCGSISYKEKYCAVAVAKSPPFLGLGIDVEKSEGISCNSWNDIVSSQEIRELATIASLPNSMLVNLAFTLKEAYFKAQCPISGDVNLEFRDVELKAISDGQLVITPILPKLRANVGLRWNKHWCVAAVALR